MNLTRLVVLGLLAELGPRHGHQIRRDVEVTRADEWAAVKTGPLHRELADLHRLELISKVRSETVGRRPERTIYAITATGRRELDALRGRALSTLAASADPVSVGLIFAAATCEPVELAALLSRRREVVAAELDRLAGERARGLALGFLEPANSPWQAAAFRRAELHAAAEAAWHEECEQLLPSFTDPASPMNTSRSPNPPAH